ncbi:MAG: hypothetical protein C4B58_08205 [Deltaproteobacteria bacterium]|nr:MAG: hypothetical protein C4B58_08205 [Deltaproteobacteria bacterium]
MPIDGEEYLTTHSSGNNLIARSADGFCSARSWANTLAVGIQTELIGGNGAGVRSSVFKIYQTVGIVIGDQDAVKVLKTDQAACLVNCK